VEQFFPTVALTARIIAQRIIPFSRAYIALLRSLLRCNSRLYSRGFSLRYRALRSAFHFRKSASEANRLLLTLCHFSVLGFMKKTLSKVGHRPRRPMLGVPACFGTCFMYE